MILPLVAFLSLACSAQSAGQKTVSLIGDGQFVSSDVSQWGSNADSFVVFESHQPTFKHAGRAIFTTRPGGNPWDIGLHVASTNSISKGAKVSIRAWIRSDRSSTIALIYEQASQPFAKFINKEIDLSSDWTEYKVEGVADQNYDPGGAQFTIFLGYGSGSMEIGDVRVETVGEPFHPVSLVPSNRLSNGEISGWAPTKLSSFTSVDANQPRFAHAVQATYSVNSGDNPWDESLHVPSIAKVTRNHTIYIRAWLRSSTSSMVSLIFEQAAPPNSKFIDEGIGLTPEWKEYRVAGISDVSYGPGEAQLTVFLGYKSGAVEIGDIQVEDIGIKPIQTLPLTISYYRKAPSDAWRAPALERIEKYRKGDLNIRVVDKHGRPVPGVSVHVDQVQQEFRFGSAVPAALLVDKSANGDRFRATVQRLFNTITFENDLKWTQLTPKDYTDVDAAYKWLDARGFRVRGHNLVWGSYRVLPQGIKEMTDAQIVATIKERIKTMVTRFKGKVYLWDVVNEAVTERELWDRIGWDKFYDTYRWAHEANPNVELCYNDFDWTEEDSSGDGHRFKSIELVKSMLKQGTPLDVIGLQSHVGKPITPMDRVIEITNEIAALGKPLEVTEYDLGVLDDKVNGEHMRDFLTAMYSVPQVQSFVMWGFWAGAHWRAKEGGAMFNLDWTPRPAAVAWEDLVKHQWWTKASLTTDTGGNARTRVFLGKLIVSATRNGTTAIANVSVLSGKPGSVTVVLP